MNVTGKGLARRHRWRACYLGLVVASCAVQCAWPPAPAPRPGERVACLAPQTAAGPVAGPPVRLAFRDVGRGEAVVLIHGSPGAVADFGHLEPALAARFRVLIPDLPGFGHSARWLPDYGIRAHARYLRALLDDQGIPSAHVVGFSMGGGVALHLADLAPDRVRSVTLCGGIGVQEGEGTGDYAFEYFKYAAAYAGLVAAPEAVPHFGLLGSRSFRHTFARNFWDTDQRPLRGILGRLRQPLLILHGRRDPLVPVRVAEEHHRLVPHSELVVFDAGHFLILTPEGSTRVAGELLPFLTRHNDPAAAPAPRTVDHAAGAPPAPTLSPELHLHPGVNPWGLFVAVAAAAVVADGGACLAVGLLVRDGQLDFGLGLLACILGGVLGDAARWRWGCWPASRSLAWSAATRLAGTPLLLATAVLVGQALVSPVHAALGTGWPAFGLVLAAGWLIHRLAVGSAAQALELWRNAFGVGAGLAREPPPAASVRSHRQALQPAQDQAAAPAQRLRGHG
jgi:pimeloyl-ACP methyl ester carboxylesterase